MLIVVIGLRAHGSEDYAWCSLHFGLCLAILIVRLDSWRYQRRLLSHLLHLYFGQFFELLNAYLEVDGVATRSAAISLLLARLRIRLVHGGASLLGLEQRAGAD